MKLKDINPIPPKEYHRIISEFNNTAIEYPKDKCIYQIFEKQVEFSPEKPAVIDGNTVLSYYELKKRIIAYCSRLQTLEIKKGDIVAIHLKRSFELIVFQFAIITIGAVFLPVDKRYPYDRIKNMCNDCNVKLLISDEIDQSNDFPVLSIGVFKSISSKSYIPIPNENVCYIIYTSGSTGKPKGCMLNQYGLLNFCLNNNTLEVLKKKQNNVFACVNSVSFDYFIAESLLPLLNGYTTVIFDEDSSTSQKKLLISIVENNINVLMTTPTRLKLFYDEKEDCTPLEQLDVVCSSGEPLTEELFTIILKKSPFAQVYNPLGPSECTVWNTGGKLE